MWSHGLTPLFLLLCSLLSGKSVKDLSTVVECVHAIIDYSRKLQRLSNEDDLIPGLGMVGGGARAHTPPPPAGRCATPRLQQSMSKQVRTNEVSICCEYGGDHRETVGATGRHTHVWTGFVHP